MHRFKLSVLPATISCLDFVVTHTYYLPLLFSFFFSSSRLLLLRFLHYIQFQTAAKKLGV